jgi:glycosyltransferase involved in cell wall biosynthesis
MTLNINFTAVIPAYNEEESVGLVVTSILKEFSNARVIVVNDGSQDKTEFVAMHSGAIVLTHPYNCGVGAALRTGLMYAYRNPFGPVVTLDADGQHNISDVIKFFEYRAENTIVVGCRQWTTFNANLARKFAQNLLVKMLWVRFNLKISDPTSGFRLLSEDVLAKIIYKIEPEYLDDTVILLINAKAEKIKIVEVSSEMYPRRYGVASHNFIQSLVRYLAMVLKILIRGEKIK